MKYEELRRLETNIEILESYCEHVCSSKTRTKEQLERVEKQISATGTRRMTSKCHIDSYKMLVIRFKCIRQYTQVHMHHPKITGLILTI